MSANDAQFEKTVNAHGSCAPSAGSAIRRCEKCNREGQLVDQAAQPGSKHGHPSMHYEPWVFRYYLCRWHRAAWNRTRLDRQKKMAVLEYRPDSELLPNADVMARPRETSTNENDV